MTKRDARRRLGKAMEREKVLSHAMHVALAERNAALRKDNERLVRLAVTQLKAMEIEFVGYVDGMKRRGMSGHERHGLVAAAMLKQAGILQAALASGEIGPRAVNLDAWLASKDAASATRA